jgi:hypothetical protein
MKTSRMLHITLTTGHKIKQNGADVGGAAVEALTECLRVILAGHHVRVPGFDDYLMNGTAQGSDLLVTVWRGPWAERVPILTTGVALSEATSAGLWRVLHDLASVPIVTDREKPPAAPWIAERLEPGALLHTDTMGWTGDLARCIGWTWAGYDGAGSAGLR